MEKGDTATVLAPFVQGMMDAGSEVEVFYASQLKVKPCTCGQLYCWSEKPGECCIQDTMQSLYPKLRDADILVLATPVYIPIPGDLANIINRLTPLLNPKLQLRNERTRARFRDNVKIKQFVLVVTNGWWEKENSDTVVRIVKEIAEDASAEFVGAIRRPHAHLLKEKGVLTQEGKAVLDDVHKAGMELINEGKFAVGTLERVSRPLISREQYWANE